MARSPAMTSAMGKDSPRVADEAQRYALHAEGGQRPRHVEAFAATAPLGAVKAGNRCSFLGFSPDLGNIRQGVVLLQFGTPWRSSRLPASSRPGQKPHGVLISSQQKVAGGYCLANLNIQRIHDGTGQPGGHGHSEK